MERTRRKLTDRYGETKVRSVWWCRTKLGTMPGSYAFFFDRPAVGLHTECVPDRFGGPERYTPAIGVLIDRIDGPEDDPLIRCELF